MKPTKNSYYCHDCGKTKMLFSSEQKANNFIRFNAREIQAETGKSPSRSYYCISCLGWHVSSKGEYNYHLPTRTERVINVYKSQKCYKIHVKQSNLKILNENYLIFCEKVDRVESYIRELEQLVRSHPFFEKKVRLAEQEIASLKDLKAENSHKRLGQLRHKLMTVKHKK